MANTTPAAAMVSVFTGSDAKEVVGIGANLPPSRIDNKVDVVRRAIAINQPNPRDGIDVLSKVGGFDLVGMTGVMLGAARWLTRIAGWLSFLLGSAGGLSDCACGETLSDPVALFGGKGRPHRARAFVYGTLFAYGDAVR